MEVGALNITTVLSCHQSLPKTSSSRRLVKLRPSHSSSGSFRYPLSTLRLRSAINSVANISSASPSVVGNDHNCEFQLPPNPGTCSSDNIDSWKWRLTTLIHDKDKQELVSREKQDRRDFEQIAALANELGLHSRLYFKVVVVSKVPLPNYRFDLDDKRPQREVTLPPGLQTRVHAHLEKYLSLKTKSTDGSRDNLFSTTVTNGSITTNEGFFEKREPSSQNKAAVDKVLRRKSMQLHVEQQAWQKSAEGQKMLELRRSLPAYKEKDAILSAISKNQVKLAAERQHKFPNLF